VLHQIAAEHLQTFWPLEANPAAKALPEYVQDVSGRSLQYPVPTQLSNGGWREMQKVAQHFVCVLAE
jgi:hypothetical protein